MLNTIDRINLRTMRSKAVIHGYAQQRRLLPHERAALDAVSDECRGTSVLDLGVGGGRTVSALLKVSDDYLGIDYSPEMVAACRRRHPWVRFAVADARDLGCVADNSLGLVMFSGNGISMVSHEDRQRILCEVARKLRPGGVFVFTTYNRNSAEATAGFRWPRLQPTLNPGRLGVRLLRYVRDLFASLANRRRNLRYEVHREQYSIINDHCHNHGVMLYYIDLAAQRQQLLACGFLAAAEAFDCHGMPATALTTLDSMAFVARKPAA